MLGITGRACQPGTGTGPRPRAKGLLRPSPERGALGSGRRRSDPGVLLAQPALGAGLAATFLAADLVAMVVAGLAAPWLLVVPNLLSLPAFAAVSSAGHATSYALTLMAAPLDGGATLALGTNFSLLPHYRTLVTAGPYRLVRHPLYASYLLADGTLAVGMASGAAVALWLVELALLADRARREERLLAAADPVYHAYAATVRYRLIPFIL